MLFARELFFAVALILALEINYITCDIFQVIETNDGAIRGVKNTTYSKKVNYYSFKGIPYAEKPIGELRFKVLTLFRYHLNFRLTFLHKWYSGTETGKTMETKGFRRANIWKQLHAVRIIGSKFK